MGKINLGGKGASVALRFVSPFLARLACQSAAPRRLCTSGRGRQCRDGRSQAYAATRLSRGQRTWCRCYAPAAPSLPLGARWNESHLTFLLALIGRSQHSSQQIARRFIQIVIAQKWTNHAFDQFTSHTIHHHRRRKHIRRRRNRRGRTVVVFFFFGATCETTILLVAATCPSDSRACFPGRDMSKLISRQRSPPRAHAKWPKAKIFNREHKQLAIQQFASYRWCGPQ